MKVIRPDVNILSERVNKGFDAVNAWIGEDSKRFEAIFYGAAIGSAMVAAGAEVAAHKLRDRNTTLASVGEKAFHLGAAGALAVIGEILYVKGDAEGYNEGYEKGRRSRP
jgi:hypothetical protein